MDRDERIDRCVEAYINTDENGCCRVYGRVVGDCKDCAFSVNQGDIND